MKEKARQACLNKLLADQGRKPSQKNCNGQSSKTRPPTKNPKMSIGAKAPRNKSRTARSTADEYSDRDGWTKKVPK